MSQKDINLDQILAGMAEDVPPMPADFHDKWMNAVRAEAKQTEAPVPIAVRQWPRILSIAAVFVFLIGGTFVYRSTRKTIQPESKPLNAVTVTDTVGREADTEEEVLEKDTGDAVFEAAGSAGETEYEADFSVGSGLADVTAARKSTNKAAESASAVMAEEAAAPEAPETNAPAAEAPENAPAERGGIAGFFTDMGAFLLDIWPYLLIAVVPLIIAAGVKKLRKK